MSEELVQRGFTKKGIIIIDYEFFPLHSTTLKQYKKSKIILNKDYGKYEVRKPDGLLVDRGNKLKPKVIAVLEYKKPSEFQTDKQKRDAIEQCNDLCQELEAQIGIITDGIVTYWINPNHTDKVYLGKLPIKKTTKEKQKEIINLVKKINKENLKKILPELDKKVYKLYGITKTEQDKINGGIKANNV